MDDRCSRRRNQTGFSIIEVLIALVVVSLGMLGIAGLQLTGMKHSTGAFNRSKATLYAEDIASRMRVNLGGVQSGAYDGHDSSAVAGYCGAYTGPLCDESRTSTASSCSTDELAAFDLYAVSCGIDGLAGVNGDDLPNASLRVECDGTCPDNGTWSISVNWTEGDSVSETAGDTTTRRVLMTLRP